MTEKLSADHDSLSKSFIQCDKAPANVESQDAARNKLNRARGNDCKV